MKYFFVRKRVDLNYEYLGYKTSHIFNPIPEEATEVDNKLIYFTTGDHLNMVGHECFKTYNEDRIYEISEVCQDNFPVLLNKDKKIDEVIKPFLGKKILSVGIVNGMSSAMGDHLIGVKALNILHTELLKYFEDVEFTLYQMIPKHVMGISFQEPIVKAVVGLPASLDKLEAHDVYIDFGGMIVWENFNNQNMIDFYLEELGLDKNAVPASAKRCVVKLSDQSAYETEEMLKALRSRGRPLLLFQHHSSSDIRTMHELDAAKMVDELIEKTDYLILGTLPTFKHKNEDRFVNIAAHTAKEFDRFVYLISKVDAVLTVDTMVYHVSDALAVPTVVMFTSIEPALRTKYYPYVESIMLETPKGRIYGKHKSSSTNDKFHVRKLFKKLDTNVVVEALKKITAKKQKMLTCPICSAKTKDAVSDQYNGYSLYRCVACMCEFVMPRKPQDYDFAYEVGRTNTSSYAHYFQETKDMSRDQIIAAYISQIRFIVPRRFVDFLPKGKSLDIGCSNGFWAGYMANLGFDAYGVDNCTAIIEHAKEKMKSKNFACVTDTNKLSSKLPKKWGKNFDLISSFELLEHLVDPNKFAAEVNKLLKPGGYWILSTPNRDRLPFWAGIKNTRGHNGVHEGDYPPEHLQRFNKKGHRIIAENNGFEVVSQKTTGLYTKSIESAIQEQIPNFEVTVNGKRLASTQSILEDKLNQALTKIEGYGTFIITILKKI